LIIKAVRGLYLFLIIPFFIPILVIRLIQGFLLLIDQLLDLILDRLADFYEKSQKLKSKILAALIYPCIVLAMAVLILIGLMIFVVPKFAAMFQDMDIELPGITSILINISSKMATLRFWIIVAITIVLIKLLLAFAWRISKIRYVFDMIKLKILLKIKKKKIMGL